MSAVELKNRKQVAALPVRYDERGQLLVMLMTSRETKRFIVPKGWPMKGHKDFKAAAIEAIQEAGLVGRIHRKPIGSYAYWKRFADHFEMCLVKVYLLEVDHQMPDWPEHGQRRIGWLPVDAAADLVDDPGLAPIIRKVPRQIKAHAKQSIGEQPPADGAFAPADPHAVLDTIKATHDPQRD